MGESLSHIQLVKGMAEWIVRSYCDVEMGHILLDSPEASSLTRPPKIYNFIPDLYVPNTTRKFIIIGEAKTANDLENDHTEEQIGAFLRKCSEFEGAHFVFAVPWHKTRLAKSIIKYIQAKIGLTKHVTIIIPEIFPG